MDFRKPYYFPLLFFFTSAAFFRLISAIQIAAAHPIPYPPSLRPPETPAASPQPSPIPSPPPPPPPRSALVYIFVEPKELLLKWSGSAAGFFFLTYHSLLELSELLLHVIAYLRDVIKWYKEIENIKKFIIETPWMMTLLYAAFARKGFFAVFVIVFVLPISFAVLYDPYENRNTENPYIGRVFQGRWVTPAARSQLHPSGYHVCMDLMDADYFNKSCPPRPDIFENLHMPCCLGGHSQVVLYLLQGRQLFFIDRSINWDLIFAERKNALGEKSLNSFKFSVMLCNELSYQKEMHFAISLETSVGTIGPMIAAWYNDQNTSIDALSQNFPNIIIEVPLDFNYQVPLEAAVKGIPLGDEMIVGMYMKDSIWCICSDKSCKPSLWPR